MKIAIVEERSSGPSMGLGQYLAAAFLQSGVESVVYPDCNSALCDIKVLSECDAVISGIMLSSGGASLALDDEFPHLEFSTAFLAELRAQGVDPSKILLLTTQKKMLDSAALSRLGVSHDVIFNVMRPFPKVAKEMLERLHLDATGASAPDAV